MRFFCLALLFVFGGPSFAQSPYHFNLARESAWVGGSGAVLGLSFGIQANLKPFTSAQLAGLDPSRVPALDRYSLRHFSLQAQHGSDWVLYSTMVLPAVLLIDPAIRSHAGETALLIGETFMVVTALTQVTKNLVRRPRPFTYNPNAPPDLKLKRDARLSFFSGHTSTVAAMTFATATVWSDYHPNSRWKPAVWTGAAAIPATVAFLRMKGGKHFLTDVLVGYGVGAAIGWLVPKAHRLSE